MCCTNVTLRPAGHQQAPAGTLLSAPPLLLALPLRLLLLAGLLTRKPLPLSDIGPRKDPDETLRVCAVRAKPSPRAANMVMLSIQFWRSAELPPLPSRVLRVGLTDGRSAGTRAVAVRRPVQHQQPARTLANEICGDRACGHQQVVRTNSLFASH
eukprot:SAG25_NODE_1716_length_2474_cov_1.207158_2_plen_155_part_00